VAHPNSRAALINTTINTAILVFIYILLLLG
jgi:hypothetical protein